MVTRHSRLAKWLPRLALALALLLATWPAWRVLTLGDSPTIDELLALICSTPAGSPPR
jgi:hypothetical protein